MTSREPSGPVAALLAFGACAVVSIVLWFPLSLPTRILDPLFLLAASANVPLGPLGVYLFPAGLGVLTLAVPLVLTGLVVLFRKPLNKQVARLTPRLPAQSRFLVAPAFATAIFVLTWSGSHYQIPTQLGFMPQIVFPAVIGLFAFATARFGPVIQVRLASFFAWRDRFSKWVRLAAAIAIPLLVGMALNDPANTALAAAKQQFVVVLGLTTGFLALTPAATRLPFADRSSRMGNGGGEQSAVDSLGPRRGTSVGHLVGLSFGTALFADLVLSESVLAFWYCQCDLTQTGGYNVAISLGGGAAGVTAETIASSVDGGPAILDSDGNPLPRWSPDSAPDEGGYEGQPGDVLVEGRWEDPEYAQERMRQLREREKELDGFWDDVQDKSKQWLHDRHQQLEAEAAAERKVRQDAADTVDRIKQIAKRRGYDDILERADGVAVNPDGSVNIDYVNRLRDTLTSRIGLEVAAPGGKPTTTDWVTDGLMMTSQEVFTGMDADGNTSYKSMLLRGLVNVATGGTAEYVYTPVDSLYRMKAGVDRGESGATLFTKAVGGAIVDELIGRAVGGALNKGIGYVAKKFPGLTKTVSEYADDIYKRLNKPIGGGVKPAALTSHLAAKKAALEAALDSGDDDAVRALYKSGGMEDMARLESGGHITPAQAQKLNGVLTDTTDGAVDSATKKTLSQFNDDTGVKVDEMLVGDSGSSSRSIGPRSVRTDADRTLVSKFNQADLEQYARRNNISVDEAYDGLSKKLTGMQQTNIDEALKGKGLTATDVDCKCYDRIGGGGTQPDCYPEGFTNARQAQGRTTVYQADADGNFSRSYQTSGQATVDQDQLMRAQFGGDMSPDPTRIGSDELPKLLDQQKLSAAGHSDAKSLAKAVTRSDYVAGRVGQPLGNPDVVDIAGKIAANPQGQQAILQGHGLTESQFVNTARDMLTKYSPQL